MKEVTRMLQNFVEYRCGNFLKIPLLVNQNFPCNGEWSNVIPNCYQNLPKFQLKPTIFRAFLYLGANNWKEALNQFNAVLQEDPLNINVSFSSRIFL